MLFLVYILISSFLAHGLKGELANLIFFIMGSGISLYIAIIIVEFIQVILKSMSEDEYKPVKHELENLLEKMKN